MRTETITPKGMHGARETECERTETTAPMRLTAEDGRESTEQQLS